MSAGIVVWKKGHLHVGWRRLDWTDVWYTPIENGTYDQEFDIGLYTTAKPGERGQKDHFRQPVEAEVAWRSHFDPDYSEANTRPRRRDLQRQLLTDVHRYINGNTDGLEARHFEKYAVDGRNIRIRMVFAEAVKIRMGMDKKARKMKARAHLNNGRNDDDSTYSSTDSSDSDNDGPAAHINRNAPAPGRKKNSRKVRRRRVSAGDDDRPPRRRRVDDDTHENGLFMSGAIMATPQPEATNAPEIGESDFIGSIPRQDSRPPTSFATPKLPHLGSVSPRFQHLDREGSYHSTSQGIVNHGGRTPSQRNGHRHSLKQSPSPPTSHNLGMNDAAAPHQGSKTPDTRNNLSRFQPYVEDGDEEDEQLDQVMKDSLASTGQDQLERTTREASLAHIQPDDMDDDVALAEATRRSLAPSSSPNAWDFSNLLPDTTHSGGDEH